jgi:dolichol-phosphate mannosyltransferase
VKLSVIIPCYNEAATITRVLEAVAAVPLEKEIVVVDDASTDDTRARIEAWPRRAELVTCYKPANEGKGAAIRSGLALAGGDVVEADVVYGSRFRGSITGMALANRLANHLLTGTANLLYRAGITDEATCYKAFRGDLIRGLPLRCRRFEFCPEVTAKVRRRGVRIHEVPIRYAGRTAAGGKKIRWTDGLSALWTLVRYRFGE